MKCPYCGEEMEKGLIPSRNEIAWFPGSDKPWFARAKFKEDVALSKLNLLHGSAVIAWLCRGCEKVIIDCAGGAADFNKTGKKYG